MPVKVCIQCTNTCLFCIRFGLICKDWHSFRISFYEEMLQNIFAFPFGRCDVKKIPYNKKMVPLVERKNCHIDHTVFTWIARKVSVNVIHI